MSTEPAAPWDRWVGLEACANFRDAGGYAAAGGTTVRRGVLYRSASPSRMTPADLACARDEVGIRTVIDLRAEAEAKEAGPAPFDTASGVRLLAVPMGRGVKGGVEGLPDLSDGLGPLYVFNAEQAPDKIAKALRTVAAYCDEPLVVHCAGGKDRTGVVVALILDILGVDHETIVEDYALTELHLQRIPAEHLAAMAKQVGEHGWPEAILHAVPESMRHFLQWLRDEHGSAEAFVRRHDSGSGTVATLRERLLLAGPPS